MKIPTSPLREAPKIRKLWACFGVLSLLFIAPASAQSLAGIRPVPNLSISKNVHPAGSCLASCSVSCSDGSSCSITASGASGVQCDCTGQRPHQQAFCRPCN